MNAPVVLFEKAVRATVDVHSQVPSTHVSTAIGLGTERRGTGTIVSPDGLIATIHYLLLGASGVMVTLGNGDQFEASIVGKDYTTGLGLVKINAGRRLPCLGFASSALNVTGQEAFTVGSMGSERRCADSGVITYLGPFDAIWEFMLDRCVCVTASSLQIGFPGGPIVDHRGQAIAISYLNFTDIGRAILGIPGEYFLAVRDELIAHGRRVSAPPRAWLGVLSYTIREHVVIANVMPGAPSEKAGLKQGDLVLEINGDEITDRRTMYQALSNRRPGERLNLKVLRENRICRIEVAAIRAEDYFG